MNRAELEKRLVEDEDFRGVLEALRKVRDNMDRAEYELADTRLRFYELVARLVIVDGVPPAFVARQVGLSPQRINGIVQQIKSSLGPVPWAADQVRRSRQRVQDDMEPRAAEGREVPVEEETRR